MPGSGLDLLSLAHYKHLVHPKFTFHLTAHATAPSPPSPGKLQTTSLMSSNQSMPSGNEVCDLFDTLITNGETNERLASASGVDVLVPGSCSFLISDIKRLRPLLGVQIASCSCWV